MRPHVHLGTRALATLVFFFGSALLNSSLAYSAQTIPVHTYSAVETRFNAESSIGLSRQNRPEPASTTMTITLSVMGPTAQTAPY